MLVWQLLFAWAHQSMGGHGKEKLWPKYKEPLKFPDRRPFLEKEIN